MFIKSTLLAAILALTATVSAVPTPKNTDETYVTGYPICGWTGYHVPAATYSSWEYEPAGMTLSECINKCREFTRWSACASIEYTPAGGCTFFNQAVEKTQLVLKTDFTAETYDVWCPVP